MVGLPEIVVDIDVLELWRPILTLFVLLASGMGEAKGELYPEPLAVEPYPEPLAVEP